LGRGRLNICDLIFVTDVELDGEEDGFELTRYIKSSIPEVKFVLRLPFVLVDMYEGVFEINEGALGTSLKVFEEVCDTSERAEDIKFCLKEVELCCLDRLNLEPE
jgi:hypothetical protein